MQTALTQPGGKIRYISGTVGLAAGGQLISAVPTGKRWKLLSLSLDVTCTATVGNRLIYAYFTDPTATVNTWLGALSGAVTASQVLGYDIGFGNPIGAPSTAVRYNRARTANVNVMVRENSALCEMSAAAGIAIDDTANIDIADATTFCLTVVEYDV